MVVVICGRAKCPPGAACPIQIDYARLPLESRASEKPTDRKALSGRYPLCASRAISVACVAQTAAFAVCGSSLGSRFRNQGQTPVIENYGGAK